VKNRRWSDVPSQPEYGNVRRHRSPYMQQRKRKDRSEGILAGLGCMGVSLVILANVAWWAFVVWVIYKVVMWLTAQDL
jgi:hypothetical protein